MLLRNTVEKGNSIVGSEYHDSVSRNRFWLFIPLSKVLRLQTDAVERNGVEWSIAISSLYYCAFGLLYRLQAYKVYFLAIAVIYLPFHPSFPKLHSCMRVLQSYVLVKIDAVSGSHLELYSEHVFCPFPSPSIPNANCYPGCLLCYTII